MSWAATLGSLLLIYQLLTEAAHEVGMFCFEETNRHQSLGLFPWKCPNMTLTSLSSHDVSAGILGLECTWTNLTRYKTEYDTKPEVNVDQ